MVIIIYEVHTDFSNFSFSIFLYRNFYFCTEIYISVLGYTLLYCCIHVFYFIVLKNLVAHCNEYVCCGVYVFVLIFFCAGAVICVLIIGDTFL